MRLSSRFLAFTLLTLGLMGCGGGFLFNQSYLLDSHPSSLKLAILPVATDDPDLFDTLFCNFFDDSTHTQSLLCPSEIRAEFESDANFPALLDRLITAEYTKDEIKTGTSIGRVLSGEELTYLRSKLGDADIALLPVLMRTRDMSIFTSGISKMRLIDLRTGSLIYENTFDMNVNYGGEIGKKLMALGLIAFARDDYIQRFWDRFAGQ